MISTILIIDDEDGIRESLKGILEDEGYAVLEAESAEAGLDIVEQRSLDLVFLDVWLPGMDGIKALKKIKERREDIPVIMISGHATVEHAVTALRFGAHDFIEKPLSLEKVLVLVQNTLEVSVLRRENQALKTVMLDSDEERLVGESPPMLLLREEVARVAPTDASVLITGENGTGKEVVARSVHRASKRAAAPLVAVNCAAIPEELIESELFGHEKGAFTGADSQRIGRFELAHSGTLFLDEIGDMSLKTQAKILRILEDQGFERVGGTRTIKVNVRIIAATNKNLEDAIKRGEFREDLFYRLRVFPLKVPPLRERTGDLRLLVAAMSARAEVRMGLKAPLFSQDAVQIMEKWPWPGNVRELSHFIERMAILYPGGLVEAAKLPPEMQTEGAHAYAEDGLAARFLASDMDFKSAKAFFETWYLQKKLEDAGGNITRLAEMVGLERSYLHRKIKAGRMLQDDEPGGE